MLRQHAAGSVLGGRHQGLPEVGAVLPEPPQAQLGVFADALHGEGVLAQVPNGQTWPTGQKEIGGENARWWFIHVLTGGSYQKREIISKSVEKMHATQLIGVHSGSSMPTGKSYTSGVWLV